MTNPQLGFAELAAAQSQPEVTVNFALLMLARAAAGLITIDFASDANYTLDSNDPVTGDDEWPYGTIRMTDTGPVLTGGVDVIYPDVDGISDVGPSRMRFVFVNDTAETLTIKRSGQTGVAVTAGNKALVYHDGSDIVAIVNPL